MQLMTDKACEVICIASWNADLVSRVARPIARGETLMAHSFDIQPGGKGSNAAVAAARQGAKVGVIARIGDDDFGRMAMQLWAKEGVATEYVEVATSERSGVAQILVFDDGDNSIAVAMGAGAGLCEANIDKASETIANCKVMMASNEVPQAATIAAFKIAKNFAKSTGITTILNPAPAKELPAELIAMCDVLTPNETEVRVLAGMPASASIEAAAEALLDKGARAIIVTLGAEGCVRYRRGTVHNPLALDCLRIQGWKMTKVADTIGAGDTYTGALAAAVARGETLDQAMTFANAAAALSVLGHGAIAAMPRLAEVKALLLSHP
jgi:ribokinase